MEKIAKAVGKTFQQAGPKVSGSMLTGYERAQSDIIIQQPTAGKFSSTTGSFPFSHPSDIPSSKFKPFFEQQESSESEQPAPKGVVHIIPKTPLSILVEELNSQSTTPIPKNLWKNAVSRAKRLGYRLGFVTKKAEQTALEQIDIKYNWPINAGFQILMPYTKGNANPRVFMELGEDPQAVGLFLRTPEPLKPKFTKAQKELEAAQQHAQEKAKQELALKKKKEATDDLKAKEIEAKNQRDIKDAQDAAEMETLLQEIEEAEVRGTIEKSAKEDLEKTEEYSKKITAERKKLEEQLAKEQQALTALEQERLTKKSEHEQQLKNIEQRTAQKLAKEEQNKEAFLAEQRIKTAARKKELEEIEAASLQAQSDALKAEQDLIEAQTKLDNATTKTQQEEINVQIKQKQLEQEQQDIKKLEKEHTEIESTIKEIKQNKEATQLNLTAQLQQIEADTATALAQAEQNYIKDLEESKAKLSKTQSFIDLDYNEQQNTIAQLENESKEKTTATELSIKQQKEATAKKNQEDAIKEQQEYDAQQAQLLKSKDAITTIIKTRDEKAQQFALEIKQIKDQQAADKLKLLDLQNNIKTIQQQKDAAQSNLTKTQEQIIQAKKDEEKKAEQERLEEELADLQAKLRAIDTATQKAKDDAVIRAEKLKIEQEQLLQDELTKINVEEQATTKQEQQARDTKLAETKQKIAQLQQTSQELTKSHTAKLQAVKKESQEALQTSMEKIKQKQIDLAQKEQKEISEIEIAEQKDLAMSAQKLQEKREQLAQKQATEQKTLEQQEAQIEADHTIAEQKAQTEHEQRIAQLKAKQEQLIQQEQIKEQQIAREKDEQMKKEHAKTLEQINTKKEQLNKELTKLNADELIAQQKRLQQKIEKITNIEQQKIELLNKGKRQLAELDIEAKKDLEIITQKNKENHEQSMQKIAAEQETLKQELDTLKQKDLNEIIQKTKDQKEQLIKDRLAEQAIRQQTLIRIEGELEIAKKAAQLAKEKREIFEQTRKTIQAKRDAEKVADQLKTAEEAKLKSIKKIQLPDPALLEAETLSEIQEINEPQEINQPSIEEPTLEAIKKIQLPDPAPLKAKTISEIQKINQPPIKKPTLKVVEKIKHELKYEMPKIEPKRIVIRTDGPGGPDPDPLDRSETYTPKPIIPKPPIKKINPIKIEPFPDITPIPPAEVVIPITFPPLPDIEPTPQTTTPISTTPSYRQPATAVTPTLKIPLDYYSKPAVTAQPHYWGQNLRTTYSGNKLTPTKSQKPLPTAPSLFSPSPSYSPMVEQSDEPILSGEQHAGALPSDYKTFIYEEPKKEQSITAIKPVKLIGTVPIVKEVQKIEEKPVALKVPQIDLPRTKEAEKPIKKEEIHWFWRMIMAIKAYIRQLFSS